MVSSRRAVKLAVALTAAATASWALAAGPTMLVNNGPVQMRQSPITDKDIAAARPLMPTANGFSPTMYDLNAAMAMRAEQQSRQVDVAGAVGGAKADHLARMVGRSQYKEADGIDPQAYGTAGVPFTSGRFYGGQGLAKSHPYRMAGKLFFKDSAGNTYWCTGSMIRTGIVVTAGHCLNNGQGSWYNSWTYIPGYQNGYAPYGTWTNWVFGQITVDWLNGGGAVPNLRDWAILVFGQDGSGNTIGAYTGYFGYQYPSFYGQNITQLGYPGNMDSGNYMQRTNSMVASYGTNNGTWGSDQRGGSSGGPLAINLRSAYDNTSPPSDNGTNRIVAVTSWGWVSTAPQQQGASQFDSVLGTMLSGACTSYPWAC